MLKDELTDAGFAVSMALTLAEAHAEIEHRVPDLAILDCLLADKSCEAVAIELANKRIPVAFCSGSDESHLPLRFPGSAFFSKPFAAVDLIAWARVRSPPLQRTTAALPPENFTS